ncbi:cytochrome P450 [Westerdykella ornata]|uniref:Cytochrome P450 n=1 Tax=Westerdykella ornata TaxID=318751 RepID=A0A6A6JBV5_WESOR|nr:cytochrome P450 [Westerdykella ornata]KAF2273694.1 cytochrome P450 [Westerdykella ornata]
MYLTIFIITFASYVTWAYVKDKRKRVLGPSLPGPKGWPLIGSVLDVPEKNAFIKFADWGKEYGDIYQVKLLRQNHVWISSSKIARELLLKKRHLYSDRPHIPALLADNRTSAKYLPLLSVNAAWDRQRKFTASIMLESKRAHFQLYPELESIRMLSELLDAPERYNHALESYVARVTCRLAWGRSEASEELKQRARELLISVSPTGHLGNKLPFIMKLPDFLSPPKAWERRRALTERAWFVMMEEQVRQDLQDNKAPPSWMRTYLASDKWRQLVSYAEEGAYMVGMNGIAGALTIAAPMQTFCLAMLHHPQYLSKLHEELDRICGHRLPRAEDRPHLPYLRACIRECFRWRPAVPTGIPHYLSEDDEYNGYHIPKGSVMHALEWAISREKTMFKEGEDPEAFNPDRWVDPTSPCYKDDLTKFPTIMSATQFGFGDRICQGQQVTDDDLLVGLGSLAWLFNIKPIPGKEEQHSGYGTVLNQGLPTPPVSETGEVSSDEDEPNVEPPKHRETEGQEQDLKRKGFLKSWLGRLWAPKPPELPIDPTLDYTTLLIAKPLPFKFVLEPRDSWRVDKVRQWFAEKDAEGLYPPSKSYWGPNEGRTEKLGWNPV